MSEHGINTALLCAELGILILASLIAHGLVLLGAWLMDRRRARRVGRSVVDWRATQPTAIQKRAADAYRHRGEM